MTIEYNDITKDPENFSFIEELSEDAKNQLGEEEIKGRLEIIATEKDIIINNDHVKIDAVIDALKNVQRSINKEAAEREDIKDKILSKEYTFNSFYKL